ncbi:MAG: hypothetical protein IPH08_04575 [Rhodocyclaceae bacterium]|nr:hypothetical protein [Rhodocyclaceae bacterium]
MMAAELADIDTFDPEIPIEERQRWHREAFRKQQVLQQTILTGDPAFLKRLVRHKVLIALHEELEADPVSDVIAEPAMVSGTTQFFAADLFSQDWEVTERAHLIPDSCSVELGQVGVRLSTIRTPHDAPSNSTVTTGEDLFSRA